MFFLIDLNNIEIYAFFYIHSVHLAMNFSETCRICLSTENQNIFALIEDSVCKIFKQITDITVGFIFKYHLKNILVY